MTERREKCGWKLHKHWATHDQATSQVWRTACQTKWEVLIVVFSAPKDSLDDKYCRYCGGEIVVKESGDE